MDWSHPAVPMALALVVVFVPLLLACGLTRDPDRAALRKLPRGACKPAGRQAAEGAGCGCRRCAAWNADPERAFKPVERTGRAGSR